jgi:3-oxoacyl-[acyl-carrier-protein] synthase-1
MGVVRGYPVTACSACSALGPSTGEALEALAAGRSGLTPSPLELPFETWCGAMDRTLPAPPEPIARYDTRLLRITLLAFEGVASPVAAAVHRWGSDRVAVILGTSTGGIEQTEEAYRWLRRDGRVPAWFDLDRQHAFHLPAEALAELVGARGPRYVISTACSSGGKTLAAARRLIEAGVIDAALTGAVDGLCQTTLRGFHSLSILSARPCRPFSSERAGISIGEGAGLLLVERDGDAAVELLGVGESSDAFHMSSPDPEGHGAKAAMAAALGQAGLTPADVGHINTHGTGTKHNDLAESKAIFDMFGADVPVVSTKGYTGHLLGAGGAVEAVFAVSALDRGWIPASLGSDPVDGEVRMRVNLERRDLRCRAVLSNSFGFGGSNVSVLFGVRS